MQSPIKCSDIIVSHYVAEKTEKKKTCNPQKQENLLDKSKNIHQQRHFYNSFTAILHNVNTTVSKTFYFKVFYSNYFIRIPCDVTSV